MTQDGDAGPARPETGPTLRLASLVVVCGYVLAFGTPWATFSAFPKLFAPMSAAQTVENVLAHPSLLAWAIFWMLVNFVGDVLGAWGMYALLRPVNRSVSLFAAWIRVVYTAVGLGAVQNLVTAYRLVTVPDFVTALGASQRDAHVEVAMGTFQAQFDFALIIFGLYLAIVGALDHALRPRAKVARGRPRRGRRGVGPRRAGTVPFPEERPRVPLHLLPRGVRVARVARRLGLQAQGPRLGLIREPSKLTSLFGHRAR
jgi:hypothetical protein